MRTIYISDPEWQETFPHRVAPLSDEWLAGLLLRCDEVNGWDSGATGAHLTSTVYQSSSRPYRINVIEPSLVHLKYLSQMLAIPISAIVATTYRSGMKALRSSGQLLLIQLNSSFQLSICPSCVEVARILRRNLILPHITICSLHHLTLQSACQCGALLRLFTRKAQPFTCYSCGLDWGRLPRIQASPERIALQQQLLSYYEFFFSKGTPNLISSILRLIEKREGEGCRRDIPSLDEDGRYRYADKPLHLREMLLGYVVSSLVSLNLSLADVMSYAEHWLAST